LALTPFHGAKALTADELARHLGVQSWETTVDLSPGSFTVYLIKISDGKLEKEGAGFAGDPDGSSTHLVIMIGTNRGKSMSTILIGNAWSTDVLPLFSDDFQLLSGTFDLPKKIKAGDYILGGMWKKKDGVTIATHNVADVESGLLLRVLAK
jgi:hypothetical protein